MSSVTGPVGKFSTDPRAASVGGIAFGIPIGDDAWNAIVAAWNSGKEIKVIYDDGPPLRITGVGSPTP